MLLPLYRLSHTDTHIHQSDIRSCLPFNLWLQAQASDSEWRTRVAVTICDHEVSECVSANVTTSTTLFSDNEYMYSSDAFFFFLKVWIIQRKCEEEMYSKVANLLSWHKHVCIFIPYLNRSRRQVTLHFILPRDHPKRLVFPQTIMFP